MRKRVTDEWLRRHADLAYHRNHWAGPRFPPSPYYRFFEYVARDLKPKVMVELGVCGGGASFYMAHGHPQGMVIGIDNRNDYPDNMKYIGKTCPNFRFVQGDSVGLAGEIFEAYGKVDFLFIDTVHTYERTLEEFKAWEPFLGHNALVFFDDLDRPGMEDAWNDLPPRKLRLDHLHHESGFGVMVYQGVTNENAL